MDQNHPPLLSRLSEPETPPDLLDRVMGAIRRARVRRLRVRFALFVSGFAASVGYAAVNWPLLWEEIRTSSFVEFLLLAASDPDVVFANGKDFAYGLLEALPLEAMLAAFAGAFFLLAAVVLTDALRHIRRMPHINHSVPST